MKRFYFFLFAVMAAASCKVVDPYIKNPTKGPYMYEVCRTIFEADIDKTLKLFYNAYNIAVFQNGDAELKVSPQYDLIRTGLVSSDGVCEYDNVRYNYNGEDFFSEKGMCRIFDLWRFSMTVLRESPDTWTIGNADGLAMSVTVLESGDDGMKLSVTVDGRRIEESTYYVMLISDGLKVDIAHKKVGKVTSAAYEGTLLTVFYDGDTLLKTCRMTFQPGHTTSFDFEDNY